MSEVYVREPTLSGKVVVHTSVGELTIELWSREAPLACRNFVQLCLEGYYHGCHIHRILPGFIIQTGDPTNTGDGGESIYGEGFADEYHTRLKFRYRGLVGMANQGRGTKTNNSQFFITLGRCDILNNRNTLFGKVTGHTAYNLVKIGELPINPKTERPLEPPIIHKTEVISNPFPDIIPRLYGKALPEVAEPINVQPRRPILENKKSQLLSFEEEDEEDDKANLPSDGKGLSKSAHDLLSDPRLLKTGACSEGGEGEKITQKNTPDKNSEKYPSKKISQSKIKQGDKEAIVHRVKERLSGRRVEGLSSKSVQTKLSHDDESSTEGPLETIGAIRKGQQKVREDEMASLKSEIQALKYKATKETTSQPTDELKTEYDKRRDVYLKKKRDISSRQREDHALAQLTDFTQKLKKMRASEPLSETAPPPQRDTYLPDLDEPGDESDGQWLLGSGLKFAVDSARAYDLAEARDELEVFDPLAGHVDAEEIMRKIRNARAKPNR